MINNALDQQIISMHYSGYVIILTYYWRQRM